MNHLRRFYPLITRYLHRGSFFFPANLSLRTSACVIHQSHSVCILSHPEIPVEKPPKKPRNLLAFYCAKRRRHDVDFNQLFNNVHGLSIIKDPRDVNLLKTGKLQLSSALNSQQTIESTYFSLEHSLKIGTLSSDYRLKNLPRVGDFLPFGHFNTG